MALQNRWFEHRIWSDKHFVFRPSDANDRANNTSRTTFQTAGLKLFGLPRLGFYALAEGANNRTIEHDGIAAVVMFSHKSVAETRIVKMPCFADAADNNTPRAYGLKVMLNAGGLLFSGPSGSPGGPVLFGGAGGGL
jgi:hypothetical protein